MTLKYYGDAISDKLKTLAIIPAAGLGTRVGSPPAKELMPHPYFAGSFLEAILDRCRRFNLHPLVISREDKHALNQVLEKKYQRGELSYITIPATREWTFTVAEASPYFGQRNILLLPDAVFEPEEMIETMLNDLQQIELSLATFTVEQPKLWGCVRARHSKLELCEKPQLTTDQALAWGVLAFHANSGRQLFDSYKQTSISHDWIEFSGTYRMHQLDSFTDLQR